MNKFRVILVNKSTDNESWDGDYYDTFEEAQESASILLSQSKVLGDVVSYMNSSINDVYIENNDFDCLIQEVDEKENVVNEHHLD